MGSHSLLQGIFLTQGLNPCLFCLLSWQVGSLPLGPQIGAISFYPMRVCSVVQSRLILCNPMDYSPPGSSVHRILQARIFSGLPCPPPGDLPDPGMEPASLTSPALQADSLPAKPSGKPPGKTWRRLKCILLCKSSQSEKATYCIITTM